MTIPSPRRRKSLGLTERNLNKHADDNLTLPLTGRKGARGVSLGGAALGGGGDHTMTSTWDLLSKEQQARRMRQPRKSILKFDPQPEPEPEPEAATKDKFASRKSLGFSRRVSFAPSAHVRMFEKDGEKEKKRRKSSMGMMGARRPSLPGVPGRRSSIQIPQPAARAFPESPRSPRSPRTTQYFVGEGEEQGEESMEMSEDEESVASVDSDEILQELTSPRASTLAIPPPEADESYATDEEEEMDMEETAVMDAHIQQPWNDEDEPEYHEEDEEDMSLEDVTTSTGTDEEKTMDFTVALGGVMPSVPPQGARPNRNSIGYLNPGSEHEEPLHPGDGTDESVMMETAVYGGVYADESVSSGEDTAGYTDQDNRTVTYNFTNASGMDFTTAIGGIYAGDQSGMELTMAIGGIHANTTSHSDMDFTTVAGGTTRHSQMDFTTVVGGIHAEATETGMEFTAVVGGIHQQHTSRTNIFDMTASTMRTNIFDASRPNIFAPESDYLSGQTQTGLLYPVLEPARVTEVESESERLDRSASADSNSSKSRGASSTPGRKTPSKATTPSFMRPTAASASKNKEREAEKPTTTKKKNVFAPSPETPGLQRSKSRTPRKSGAAMQTAAGVAKRLSFAPAEASTSVSSSTSSSSSAQVNPFAPIASTSSAPSFAPGSSNPTPRKSLIPRRSGTPKRPRDDDSTEEDATAKKHNIFAPDSTGKRPLFAPTPAAVEPPPPLEPSPPEDEPEEEDMEIEEETPDQADDQDQEDHKDDTPDDITDDRFASPEPAPAPPVSSYTPLRDRPRVSLTPRKSIGAPVRPVRVSLDAPPRPPRSPTPESEPEPEHEEPSEPVPITLSKFLEMTNIEFVEHLVHGRKSVGGGVLGTEDREFELYDFVTANLDSVYVNFFQWAIDKMVMDIRDTAGELGDIERALDEDNPTAVREYLMATEDERPIFEMMLREYKTNTRLRTKSDWYAWKTSIMERIRPDVQAIRDEMVADATRFRAQLEVSNRILPDLRSRHEQLKAELAAHRAAVERIEGCDQDELRELKVGVVEQNAEIERFTAELEDKTVRLTELQAKSSALGAECDAHKLAIETAKAESSESSPSDVLRLEAEYRSLQNLHGWRIARTAPLVLVFADELELTVPLSNGQAALGGAQLGLVKPSSDGPTKGLLDLTRRALVLSRPATLPALVRATGQLWTAARHVRDELNILQLYYPATFAGDDQGFTATAAVMLPKERSKASLAFTVRPGTLLAWPSVHAVTAVKVNAQVAYGSANAGRLQDSAQDTLATVVPDVPGIFYQAVAIAAGDLVA